MGVYTAMSTDLNKKPSAKHTTNTLDSIQELFSAWVIFLSPCSIHIALPGRWTQELLIRSKILSLLPNPKSETLNPEP